MAKLGIASKWRLWAKILISHRHTEESKLLVEETKKSKVSFKGQKRLFKLWSFYFVGPFFSRSHQKPEFYSCFSPIIRNRQLRSQLRHGALHSGLAVTTALDCACSIWPPWQEVSRKSSSFFENGSLHGGFMREWATFHWNECAGEGRHLTVRSPLYIYSMGYIHNVRYIIRYIHT